ncbi:MAG: hypothetical protein Q9226_008497 [Calogaya cf. arnoldii]
MNQGIPFDEYMPGASQPASQIPQESYPSASSSELDSSCHHHSDTISSCLDSPSSSPQEISPFEQEVIDLYKMVKLHDDSGLGSECDDEYDGGVSLAGHEDMMDLDGTATDRECLENPEEGSSPTLGIMPSTAISTDVLPLSIIQGTERDFQGSGEATTGDIFSQPVTTNTVDGLDYQTSDYQTSDYETSESNTQTPPTQDVNSSHEVSLSQLGPTPNSSLNSVAPQAANLLIIPEAHSSLHTPLPDQDSSANPDQLVSNNTVAPYSDDPMDDPLNDPLIDPLGGTLQDPKEQQQENMSLIDCLEYCAVGRAAQDANPQGYGWLGSFPRITDHNIEWGKRKSKGEVVSNADVASGRYDFQGIDWQAFGTTRATIRRMRARTYLNHTNKLTPHSVRFENWPMFASAHYLKLDARQKPNPISSREKYFHFSRMNLQHQICIPHPQLRHIVSASSKNAIFFPSVPEHEYTTGSQITNFNPEVENDSYIVDSAHVDRNLGAPEMKMILALSAKDDVLAAVGVNGEYAYKSLSSIPFAPFTSGMVTHSDRSSPNHVHTYLSRHSGLPQAVFSSNDSHISTLDLTTNKFVSRHDHVKYVNCSATSPDTCLRVCVRDAVHPLIVEADTGKRIGKLKGHKDFGFACDWAADGRYFATGAQDGLIQIYDMRNWSQPIQTLLAEIGGVRSLAFSPAGSSGKPVLLMGESADFVHIVDASDGMFAKKQTVDFFGEIAGVTFDESGDRFWVGVADPDFGGLMELEREKKRGRFGPVKGGKGKRDIDIERTEENSGLRRSRRRKLMVE